MDNQQATPEELGWIAGALDSEGHIRVQSYKQKQATRYRTEVNITNCCVAFLDKCIEILRKLGVNPYIRVKDRSGKRPVYHLVLTKMSHIFRFLTAIISLLTTKKEQAKHLLGFVTRRLNLMQVCKNPRYTQEDYEFFSFWERKIKGVTPETTKGRYINNPMYLRYSPSLQETGR